MISWNLSLEMGSSNRKCMRKSCGGWPSFYHLHLSIWQDIWQESGYFPFKPTTIGSVLLTGGSTSCCLESFLRRRKLDSVRTSILVWLYSCTVIRLPSWLISWRRFLFSLSAVITLKNGTRFFRPVLGNKKRGRANFAHWFFEKLYF